MARNFDFNKIKKQVFPVTLSDENKTTIVLKTPSKALTEALQEIDEDVKALQDDDEEIVEELYLMSAQIMSHNMTNTVITVKQLKELYDIDDIMAFLDAYKSFIDELTSSKN